MFNLETLGAKTPLPIYPVLGKLTTVSSIIDCCLWSGFTYNDLDPKMYIRRRNTSTVPVMEMQNSTPLVIDNSLHLYHSPHNNVSNAQLVNNLYSNTLDLIEIMNKNQQITYSIADLKLQTPIRVENNVAVYNVITVRGKDYTFIISKQSPVLLYTTKITLVNYNTDFYLSTLEGYSDEIINILTTIFKQKLGLKHV